MKYKYLKDVFIDFDMILTQILMWYDWYFFYEMHFFQRNRTSGYFGKEKARSTM